MAAPFVSGAVALIKSRWPELDINGIQSQLKPTTDDHGISGWNQQTGWEYSTWGGLGYPKT